uniref:Uncharacterized protein n=1 Tax=Acrobeloides nanus TaxID=290746 RepID=A0A914CU41_9BILA
MAQVYMIVFVRILLFVLKITCVVEDASIFGPLGIIHTIREALIANCAFALPSLAVDRYLSTRYPEEYERSTTPYIAFIILIISSIFAVRENLWICKALIPSASFMSILIIFIAILYYFIFTMQDNPDIAVTLATLYNTSLAFIFFITPFVYALPQKEMRNLVLVLIGCSSMTGTVAPVQKFSAAEEQHLYFQELQRMWS